MLVRFHLNNHIPEPKPRVEQTPSQVVTNPVIPEAQVDVDNCDFAFSTQGMVAVLVFYSCSHVFLIFHPNVS